jgi:predicted protein tyrosine phosphatase
LEQRHKKQLLQKFGSVLGTRRVVSLGIQDRYTYMPAELISLLKSRVSPLLDAPK